MPTPKENPNLLNRWRELEERYLNRGLGSRHKIHQRIAAQHHISHEAVRYWLDARYKEYIASREKTRPKRSRPNRHLQPERRAYGRDYHRLTRNLPDFLLNIFHKGEKLDLERISERLAKEAKTNPKIGRKIILSCGTLERHLEYYLNNPMRAPPIRKIRAGIYALEK